MVRVISLLPAVSHAVLDEALQVIAGLALRFAFLVALHPGGDLRLLCRHAIVNRSFELWTFQTFALSIGAATRDELLTRWL